MPAPNVGMRTKRGGFLAVAGLALALPWITEDPYILQVASLAAIGTILAVSLQLLYGHAGQLSFAHAAFYGIGAYTTVILQMQLKVEFFVALAAGAVTAGIVALLVGLPTLQLRGNYLAIATMALQLAASQLFINAGITGGSVGIFNISRPDVGGVSLASPGWYYLLLAAVTILTFVGAYLIINSRAGRALAAIREDETAARVLGIGVVRHKVSIFTITGMMAGLAGGLFAYELQYVSPDSFNLDWSIAILSMVIIGGRKHPVGAVLGAVVVSVVGQFLFSFGDLQVLIYGIWIILVMLFMPDGLAGIAGRVWKLAPRLPRLSRLSEGPGGA